MPESISTCGLNPFYSFAGKVDSENNSFSFDFLADAKTTGLLAASASWSSNDEKVVFLDSVVNTLDEKFFVDTEDQLWTGESDHRIMGSAKAVRCSWNPAAYACELPANVGSEYNVSNCSATSENKLTRAQCISGCADGYSVIPGMTFYEGCTPALGSIHGVFDFKNCVDDTELSSPLEVSSCQSEMVTKRGVYLIDLVSDSGELINNVKAYCDVLDDGSKYLDVIRTLGLASGDDKLDQVARYFYRSNNTSSIEFRLLQNDRNESGILIENIGENFSQAADERSSGFELGQWGQKFTDIKMSYHMQGASVYNTPNTPICDRSGTAYDIYLNGPGFEGGSTLNKSKTYRTYEVIQGTMRPNSDKSISVVDYENNDVLIENLFSFSGHGKADATVASCSISPFVPQIDGEYKASTFMTKLLIKDEAIKRCTIPSNSDLVFTCGGVNEDGLYHESQCEVSCADETMFMFPVGESRLTCLENGETFNFEGMCTNPTESLCVDNEIDVSFDSLEELNNNFDDYRYSSSGKTLEWSLLDQSGESTLSCGDLSIDNRGHICSAISKNTFRPPFTIEYDYNVLRTYRAPNGYNPPYPGIRIYSGEATRDSAKRAAGGDLFGHFGIQGIDSTVSEGAPSKLNIKSSGILSDIGDFDFESSDVHIKLSIALDGEIELTVSDNLNVLSPVVMNGYLSEDVDFKEMTIDITLGGFETGTNLSYQHQDAMDNLSITCPSYNDLYSTYDLPDDYTGYDITNCNPPVGGIHQASCELTCAPGFYEDELNPIQVHGDDSTGKLIFKGCYGDESNTVEKKATRIIQDRNALHLTANDYSLGDSLTSVTSRLNKYNEIYNFEHVSAGNPIPISGSNGKLFFDFKGANVSRGLFNADFPHFKQAQKVTMFIAYKPNYYTHHAVMESGHHNDDFLLMGYRSSNGYGFDNFIKKGTENFTHRSASPIANFTAGSFHTQATVINTSLESMRDKVSFYYDGVKQKNEIVPGSGNLNKLGNLTGLYIGTTYSETRWFNGEIAEVLIFDEVLSSEQISLLNKHFSIKYGETKACSLPADTTGYNVTSCDTSNEKLSLEDCVVSCDAGYTDILGFVSYDNIATSNMIEADVTCSEDSGEFILRGCFSESALNNDLVAKKIIENFSVIAMDPETLSLSDGDPVTTWTSGVNKNFNSYTFESVNTPPTFKIRGNSKYIQFNGDGFFRNEEFFEFKKYDQTTNPFHPEVTRIYVFQPDLSYQSSAKYVTVWLDNQAGKDYFSLTGSSYPYHRFSTQFLGQTLEFLKTEEILPYLDETQSPNGDLTINTTELNALELSLAIKMKNPSAEYNYLNTELPNNITYSTTDGAYIGTYINSTNSVYHYKGKISDILIFDSILSSNQKEVIYSYLKKKNSIGSRCQIPGSLPPGQEVIQLLLKMMICIIRSK